MKDTQDFKNALASWASGVTVVTTELDGKLYGLTASSFSSLSLDPPLVLVCIANSNRLPEMVRQSGRFTVSILARDQEHLSNHFARPGREPEDTLAPGEHQDTAVDVPALANAAGYVACEVHELVEQGDHTILIGRVVEAGADDQRAPLIYYRRGYGTVDKTPLPESAV
ncbi:MAG: flavin reductase [Candidatus Dadabacteria bacterium]|nr:MAG: flavin reductase [Candidatus Dadabacteria bacterium]